jgi:hypothetical protein
MQMLHCLQNLQENAAGITALPNKQIVFINHKHDNLDYQSTTRAYPTKQQEYKYTDSVNDSAEAKHGCRYIILAKVYWDNNYMHVCTP